MWYRLQQWIDDFNTWVAIIATQLEEHQYKDVPMLDDDTDMYLDHDHQSLSDADCDLLSDADFDHHHDYYDNNCDTFDNCDNDMINYHH